MRDLNLTEIWLRYASNKKVLRALQHPQWYQTYVLPRLQATTLGNFFPNVVRVHKEPFSVEFE